MKILWKVGDMRHGWRGIRAVWREEWHFSYQVAAVAVALVLGLLVNASGIEMIVLIATLCMALASEVINTAIEDVCNKIEPNHDLEIGKIKDISQAFVIVSSLPALVTILWILFEHLA